MKKYTIAMAAIFVLCAATLAGVLLWDAREPSLPPTTVPSGTLVPPVTPVASPSDDAADAYVALADLPEAPVIRTSSPPPTGSTYPTYFFLFTHTEDHINHALSEERYTRVGPMLEELQAKYPAEDITWTIEFQGADAKTVSDRDGQTGVATYLRSLADKGLVEFGYHAHHDPTYMNRPQKNLDGSSTWQEVYDALLSWVSCEKDPLKGGCVAQTGGGLMAVQENFGPVQIVTGVGAGEGAQIERSAGGAAIRARVPDRMLGFGFPDHGATAKDKTYGTTRDALMRILSPANDTTSTAFWMDNSVRLNDGVPLEGLTSLKTSEGKTAASGDLQKLDRSHANILNVGIADKFLYAAQRSSPTVWAYSHASDPELPANQLVSAADRERGYALTEETMDYLLGTYLAGTPGEFVNADRVVELVTSDDFWNVDAAELSAIAAWIVQSWDGRPPSYAYDGTDYYSLSDAFALLVTALGGEGGTGLVSRWYGPWSVSEAKAAATSVRAEDLLAFAQSFGEGPVIDPTHRVGGTTLTAGQALYAMAYQYLLQSNAEFDGDWNAIAIPATESVPETYPLLESLGCENCADTSWSFKPARFDFE